MSPDWFDWARLPDLFPVKYHGVLTNRDAFLVDIDLDRLKTRIGDYFDRTLSHEEIERQYPAAIKSTARFDARSGRDALLARGGPDESGYIRITYRPFDKRWLYWEADTKLLDEKRADYRAHVFEGNLWLSAAQHLRQGAIEPQAVFTEEMGSHHLIERGANMFPAWLCGDDVGNDTEGARRANLTAMAHRYLDRLGADVEDLFHHVLAVLHDPAYREANAGALRMQWPRIPLPGWPETAGKKALLKRWLGPRRGGANSPRCSIPILQSPAPHRRRCVRRYPRSRSPPRPMGATWPARTSR